MAEDEVRFFKSEKEFLSWLKKNHAKSGPIWLGFYKRAVEKNSFSAVQAFDIAMCYGWSGNVIRGIDFLTYRVKFAPRKAGSVWSAINVKRFLELRKNGLIKDPGEKAFRSRNQEKAQRREQDFSGAQLKRFKANKKAWEFFKSQTASYQNYMRTWVVSAKKEETRERRLEELIRDSANGSKLGRIVKANEKFKNRFEPGKTPIEEGRGLGPLTGVELRSIGIETLEDLKRVGWENAFQKLVQMYEHRFNLNMLFALAGAANDQGRRQMDAELKAECRALFREMKS